MATRKPFPQRVFPRHLALLVLPLAGCTGRVPPVIIFEGTYYSAWPVCTAIGIGGAILARILFILLGLDDGLPFRVPVYACIGLLFALGAAMMIYGR